MSRILCAEEQRVRVEKVIHKPGNKLCSDCRAVNPRWASISLGILVCMRCSGHHRKMGTHISRVKSTSLDTWQNDWLQMFELIDNSTVNSFFEWKITDSQLTKIDMNNDIQMERYIRNKYEKRMWSDNGLTPVEMIQSGTYPKEDTLPPRKKSDEITSKINTRGRKRTEDDFVDIKVNIPTKQTEPHRLSTGMDLFSFDM